jgi:hypothetical protein
MGARMHIAILSWKNISYKWITSGKEMGYKYGKEEN